jgi:hypothetical protein
MKTPIVTATKSQIEEFKKSFIWKDIKRELRILRGLFTKEYSQVVGSGINPSADAERSTATTLMHLGDIHGRESAIDYLLALPDVFLQILEDEENVGCEQTD